MQVTSLRLSSKRRSKTTRQVGEGMLNRDGQTHFLSGGAGQSKPMNKMLFCTPALLLLLVATPQIISVAFLWLQCPAVCTV